MPRRITPFMAYIGDNAGFISAVGAAGAVIAGAYIYFFGTPPHASEYDLRIIAQVTRNELIAKQAGTGTQIEILADRCRRGCDEATRKRLEVLRSQERIDQEYIDRLKKK